MEELEREPNPQPAPLPAGAVSKESKMRGFAVLVGVFLFIVMAIWLLWPRHKQSVIGPQRVAGGMQAQTPNNLINLSMEKEKAYEEGKREGLKNGQAIANLSEAQQPMTPVRPYYPPAAQTATETAPQKVAFADNMIDGGRFRLARDADQHADRLGGHVDAPTGPGGDRGTERVSTVSEIAQNVLPEGTLVYCALINQLNGDNTGPFKVQVSETVYFPGTQDIAIPQGSILIGEAQKVGAQFQQRLAVSFHSLQIGNKQIKLDKMPGLDQQGATALTDKVNNHYAQIFGASLAVGAIGGLSQIGNNSYGGINGYDASTQIRNGISQSTAQSSAQILSHFLNRMPTLIVRPGTPVVVFLTGNVEIPQ